MDIYDARLYGITRYGEIVVYNLIAGINYVDTWDEINQTWIFTMSSFQIILSENTIKQPITPIAILINGEIPLKNFKYSNFQIQGWNEDNFRYFLGNSDFLIAKYKSYNTLKFSSTFVINYQYY